MPTLRTGGRGNCAGFSNAEVDQLLDAAEMELDPAKRDGDVLARRSRS